MSNNYFVMNTLKEFRQPFVLGEDYNVDSTIFLTAYMGDDHRIQLTIQQRQGASENDQGTVYASLTNDQAKRLAYALLERVNGKITATGTEKSNYTDDFDEIG